MKYAFEYLRGMITLALTEDGWEVEGHGDCWAHWIKGKHQIAVRGWPQPDETGAFFIPINSELDPVGEDEMCRLAQRLSKATGWDWFKGSKPSRSHWWRR
jgi:hypothetical protein